MLKAPYIFEINDVPITEPGESQVLIDVRTCAG